MPPANQPPTPTPLDDPAPRVKLAAVILTSPEQTRALGVALGARLFDGAVVCLEGDLGAGKTCLAQGIAAGLGVIGTVASPTYILVAEYPEARVPLRHADLYRIEAAADLVHLGLDERIGRDGAWVVEWADRFPALFPPERLTIRLHHVPEGRRITLDAVGARHAALLEGLDVA